MPRAPDVLPYNSQPMAFGARLAAAMHRTRSLVCVGLDPDPLACSPALRSQLRLPAGADEAEMALALNRGVIAATHHVACCYKPNAGFYEALGPAGQEVLRATLALIPRETPVILDAKRGDLGSTSEAYARGVFERLGVDAVTLNPYMGYDSLQPFLDYEGRGVFVLVRTSNPGASELQEQLMASGEPLYLHLARRLSAWPARAHLGVVVGATVPRQLEQVREAMPSTLFLVPGVGSQGGSLEAAVRYGGGADGMSCVINASRSIMYATGEDWPAAVRAAAERLRDQINQLRRMPHA